MLVVRGTKKFLDRVGPAESDPPASSTILGDWYATVLFWKPQVALFVNETTLLPLLVPLAPATSVARRFRSTFEDVLGFHGVPAAFVAHEIGALDEGTYLAKTANRSAVGMLTEFAFLSASWRQDGGSLVDLSVRLAGVPCGPLHKTHITPHNAVAAAAREWLLCR